MDIYETYLFVQKQVQFIHVRLYLVTIILLHTNYSHCLNTIH